MNLVTTTFWQGLATALRLVASLITNKIMAIYLGPAGIALLGNFLNVTSVVATFANGGITSGITKYIAEYENEHTRQMEVVAHAIKINLVCSVLLAVIICSFSKFVTEYVFGDLEFENITIIFGIAIIFYGLNSSCSAALNGFKQMKYLIISGFMASGISVILAVLITIRFGLFGALVNTIIAQFFIFVVNIYFAKKSNLLVLKNVARKCNVALIKKLFEFGAMSVVTMVMINLSTFYIRNYIYTTFSNDEAGFIQGVWAISNAYLSVVTVTMSTYYLPMISSIKEKKALRKEIISGYKVLLPLAGICGLGVYFLRHFIIQLLYTSAFGPMEKFFLFQCIGDFLKIASWILSSCMIAKAMTKWFITTEILFTLAYVLLSFLFMNWYGSVGVTYAYAVNYFVYLLFMIVLFRDYVGIHSDDGA